VTASDISVFVARPWARVREAKEDAFLVEQMRCGGRARRRLTAAICEAPTLPKALASWLREEDLAEHLRQKKLLDRVSARPR
jgi:hypothetical protein